MKASEVLGRDDHYFVTSMHGDVLRRFSDGLALVETAHSALENAQEDGTSISPGVLTLQRGIDELLSAYTEFDVAISKLRP